MKSNNIKKLTAFLAAVTICASSIPANVSGTSFNNLSSASAVGVGEFDNAIASEDLPSWIPSSYDSAKEYMSKASASSTPDEISFSCAAGYIMFVWHVNPENNHGFLFSAGEMARYNNATTNKYEYFNEDNTDEYVVFVYNFTTMSQKTSGNAHLYIYTDEEKSKLGYYTLNYTADTDLSINVSGIKYTKNITVDDWEEIAQGGGASVKDGKIYLAFDQSLGDITLTLNDKEQAMAKTSKASSTGKYYNVYKYEPSEAGDLNFVITITDSENKTTTKKISLRVDSDLNIKQIDTPTDTDDKDEYSWLPSTYEEAETFLSNYGNVAVSEDYVVFAYRYSGLMNYNIDSVIDSDAFSFAKKVVVCQNLAETDSEDIRFLVYKPKKASDSFLEWHGVNNFEQLINLFYADVTVDDNLKITLNAESDNSWYPTNEDSAKSFMEKYPTGAYSGDTACYVSKDALSIESSSFWESENISYKNYKFPNGYTVTLVTNTTEYSDSIDIDYVYEDKTIEVSFISEYDESTKSMTCKIKEVKEKSNTDYSNLSFDKVDSIYKKYGNIVYDENYALIITPIENGSTLPDITMTGNGKASATFKNTVTDGTTTYAYYFLIATQTGDVNISVPVEKNKTLKTYLLVEEKDNSLVFTENPNPPEETTQPTETQTDEVITIKYGDVNYDGEIDVADAVYLNKYLVNAVTLSEAQLAAADVYNDSKVDSEDTLVLLKYLAMSINELPQKPETN